MASETRGAWSVPCDAAVQQQAKSVVVKVGESVADPLDLFDQQMTASVGPLDAPSVRWIGQNFGLPATHGAAQPGMPRESVGCRLRYTASLITSEINTSYA